MCRPLLSLPNAQQAPPRPDVSCCCCSGNSSSFRDPNTRAILSIGWLLHTNVNKGKQGVKGMMGGKYLASLILTLSSVGAERILSKWGLENFFYLGEDLGQFFSKSYYCFLWKIPKFRWGSILWFSPVPPSLPILRNKLQSHLVQKMVAIFSNLRALCNNRYQQPAREYSNHERNHDTQSYLSRGKQTSLRLDELIWRIK